MTTEECEREKRYYIKLKTSVSSISSYLKSFNSNVNIIKNKVNGGYTVNSENTPIFNRITKLCNNSNQVRSYIVKTIIPAIDLAIKKCDLELAKIQSEQKAAAAKASAARVTSING